MSTPRNTIQYREMGAVLRAYERLNIPTCAIFHGKQLMFPIMVDDVSAGAEQLQEILKDLQSSPAIYSLVCYSKLPKGELTDNTPYNASFNFRLCEYGSTSDRGLPVPSGDYGFNAGKQYMEALLTVSNEIKAMKIDLATLRAVVEEEEEEEPESVSQPIVQQSMQEKIFAGIEPLIPEIGKRLVDQMFGPVRKQPAGINGVSIENLSEEQKRNMAVTRLGNHVENLGDKLLKLADLAEQDAARFNSYLGLIFG